VEGHGCVLLKASLAAALLLNRPWLFRFLVAWVLDLLWLFLCVDMWCEWLDARCTRAMASAGMDEDMSATTSARPTHRNMAANARPLCVNETSPMK